MIQRSFDEISCVFPWSFAEIYNISLDCLPKLAILPVSVSCNSWFFSCDPLMKFAWSITEIYLFIAIISLFFTKFSRNSLFFPVIDLHNLEFISTTIRLSSRHFSAIKLGKFTVCFRNRLTKFAMYFHDLLTIFADFFFDCLSKFGSFFPHPLPKFAVHFNKRFAKLVIFSHKIRCVFTIF